MVFQYFSVQRVIRNLRIGYPENHQRVRQCCKLSIKNSSSIDLHVYVKLRFF